MKIELIKQIIDGDVVYKYKPIKFCCDEFSKNNMIELSSEYDGSEEYYKTPKMCLAEHREEYSYGDYIPQDDYTPIYFCPFCGKKIEIEVVDEEDLTDKCKELEDMRNKINEEKRNTDSKIHESELCNVIWELNKKINYMYVCCEYKEEVE